MAIEIKSGETGLIRVFAINRPEARVESALAAEGKGQLTAELLGQKLPDHGIEILRVADLADIGLSGYLAQGYDVSSTQLAADRPRLDSLEGYVLLVFSSAFSGAKATLAPGADLTLIATYSEAQADMSQQPLESDAAQMPPDTARAKPADPSAQTPKGSLVIALLALVAGLLIWWSLS